MDNTNSAWESVTDTRPNAESLDSIRDAEAIIAAGKPGYASVVEMFEAMGEESVPKDMAAALNLAKESKATVTLSLKLTIEECLKLEHAATGQHKSVVELLREHVESLIRS